MRPGRKAINLRGKRFGRLLVLRRAPLDRDGKQYRAKWVCWCDCGREFVARSLHLRDGSTKSCGCLKAELDANHARDARGTFAPGLSAGPPPRSTVRYQRKQEERRVEREAAASKVVEPTFTEMVEPEIVALPRPQHEGPFSLMGSRLARPPLPGRGRVIEIESGARGSTLADA